VKGPKYVRRKNVLAI